MQEALIDSGLSRAASTITPTETRTIARACIGLVDSEWIDGSTHDEPDDLS